MKVLRFILLSLLALLLATASASAQERRPTNLLELLFGTGETQSQPAPAPAPVRTAPRSPAPVSPAAPPPLPEIEKAPDARRVMVFGDSMAVDVARGLERFYADNDDVLIINRGVGSSGFVREDFFNWQRTVESEIAANSFDIAVVIVGINDRQALGNEAPLSEAWRGAYGQRLNRFLAALREAGKPVAWIELPPMEQAQYGAAMAQIAALQQSAVQAAGGEWVDTFERFLAENGGYSADGPDLNGNIVTMRKADGIHFSAAGADKVAFYVDRAIGRYYGGGGSTVAVVDYLAGTDAAAMMRPPFQGLGQIRLVEMASLVQQIGVQTWRASDLVVSGTPISAIEGFDIQTLLNAPAGRIDAFGVPTAPPMPGSNPGGR